jgi:hypothetical protein
MRPRTQLKKFFAGVLIALATLTVVIAPARVMGAGQSKGTAVVASRRMRARLGRRCNRRRKKLKAVGRLRWAARRRSDTTPA